MADPPPKDPDKAKPPTSCLSLPAELRNYIYDLSGCLKILQCRVCHSTIRGDDEEISHRSCCFYAYDGYGIDCEYREKAYLWVNGKSRRHEDDCGRHIGWEDTHHMEDHLDEHVVAISQPALTKVSKQLRPEMLDLFYSEHIWMFTAFKYGQVFDLPEEWLVQIGKANAASAKEIFVVLPFATEGMRALEMKLKLGRKLNWAGREAEVTLRSIAYGDCRCETCVLPKASPKKLHGLK